MPTAPVEARNFVDVSDIHLRDIRFVVTRADGRLLNFSDAVTDFTWNDHVNTAGASVDLECSAVVSEILKIGGEGSSAMITAPLIDLDTGLLVRRELWRGTFEDVIDSRSEGLMTRHITAYDLAKYFASNEEDYVFKNSTLSTILKTVLREFSVPLGSITDTSEKLGQIVSRGRSLWELFQEAVQRHFDLTGEAFYIFADSGRVHMRLQGDQSRFWVFETGESLKEVRRTRSVAEVINVIKIYGVFEGETDKPKVEATKTNADSQSKYGKRQRIEYISAAEDESKVIKMAEKTLDAFAAPSEDLEITGWLVPSLRAGEQIRFIDSDMGINRIYFVESIESSWSTDRAETIARVKREPVDPDILLSEVEVA